MDKVLFFSNLHRVDMFVGKVLTLSRLTTN